MGVKVTTGTLRDLSTGRRGFIADHNLWNDAQKVGAEEVLAAVKEHELEAVRVSFGDPHGLSRSKTLTASAFESVMRNGIGFSPGPFIFDTGLDLAFNPFEPGGGVRDDEMTGAGDFILVPDPETFQILPWSDSTGWILGDEYFKSGRPVPFSPRHLLRRMLTELDRRGMVYVVGLEVEWYLSRLVDRRNTVEGIGGFGSPGVPPEIAPINLGYQFNSENLNDEIEPFLATLRRSLQQLGLPLRTTEHESGPGQMEFTFDPLPGLLAADAMLLFRTAVKQICARAGYHASFMCAPKLNGHDASGWHLHQSIFDTETGQNLFMSHIDTEIVTDFARNFAGGLIQHAPATTIFAMPTVNGYKRLSERFSLSPDKATWSADNRGTYLRVLGAPHDPAAHFENRLGEPAANPYLYLAAQLIAGLDGVDNELDPGPMSINPHDPSLPTLPANLGEAIRALDGNELFRRRAGNEFVDFYVQLKSNEWRRYTEYLAAEGAKDDQNVVTDWEQREYFRNY